ncbi:MAG: hypothetical protein HQK97_03980 [Nitrospirae bacterium]|nr:hypothetical protein [Nitrospirota bacterium]
MQDPKVSITIKQSDSIAIFGVGRLGSSLAQELIRTNAFSRIYLFNRSEKHLNSILLSLRVYASCIGSQTDIRAISDQLPQDVGIVVIAVKENYDPRELLNVELLPHGLARDVRTIGLKKDIPLVHDVCLKLQGYNGKIVVITNPVDIFTVMINEWIPTAEVYGFGVTLDTARLVYCAQQRGIKCVANDFPLGGSHTEKLVQLKSLWNQQSPLFTQSELVNDLLRSSTEIGPIIVQGLGFTLHDCVAVFSRDVSWLAGKNMSRKYLCTSVGNDSSAVAWPLEYSDVTGSLEIFDGLTKHERQQLDSAAKIVTHSVDIIRKKLIPQLI